MKKSSPLGVSQVQLDPDAFLADPDLLHALGKRATTVSCVSDGVLFRQDEPSVGVFILHEGVVTLSMLSHDGHSLFAVQAKPGSILGLPAAISNQPFTLSAIVRAGAKVTFVSNADLTALMHIDPALSLKMLEVLAAEVRSARKALY
ncbi:MAG: cyclic nucleotide-binding domain-containing protein [Terracidiphilus sp.]